MNERKDTYSGHNIRKGLVDFLAGKGMQIAGGFATMLLLVRLLPISEYAIYVTASAMASLLGSVSLFGMDRAASRYVPQALLQGGPGVLASFVRRLAAWRLSAVAMLAMLVCLGWPWLSQWFSMPSWSQAPLLVAATVVWGVLHAMQSFQTAVMQSLMRQRAIRDATGVSMAIKVLLLLMLLTGIGRVPALVAVAVALVTDALAYAWMQVAGRSHMRAIALQAATGKWQPDWAEVRRTSWQNYLAGQLALPTQLKPLQLVAAATLPAAEVAAFGFVTSLASNFRMLLPLYLFRSLIEPVLIGRYVASNRDPSAFANLSEPVLKFCSIVVLTLVIGLVVGGKAIVDLIAGPVYATSAWMMTVLVVGMLPACWRTFCMIISNATGENFALLKYAAIASLASVATISLSFFGLGPAPILLAELVFSLVAALLFLRGSEQAALMLPIRLAPLLKMSIVATGSILLGEAIIFGVPWPDNIVQPMATLFSVVIFLCGMVAFRFLTPKEVLNLGKMLRRT